MRGANTLSGGDLSIGLGYLGQEAVCQQEEGVFDQNSLFLAIGYGLTERLQLSLQVPYTWYEADKSDFNGSGIDDVSFGLGYRFLDESGWRPALSVVGYAVAPTAERNEGLGTNEWSAGLALAASKTIVGPLSAFASAGYQYNGRGAAQVEDQFISGLGLEYVITPHVSLVAEGTANTNWRSDDRPALRLDRRDERGRASPVRRLPHQPGRPQGLHQRRAGLGRVRPRLL